MGRANRLLAPRVQRDRDRLCRRARPRAGARRQGDAHRQSGAAGGDRGGGDGPIRAPDASGPLQLLVFGGSQGARVMSDIVPAGDRAARAARCSMRLQVVQQAREEDLARVRETYAQAQVAAEVAPFFADLPARMAASHLVVSRSGASTVAELAAIGRPGILVPLPHALDQDQRANAGVLERGRRRDPPRPGRVHAGAAGGRDRRARRRAGAARRHGRGRQVGRRRSTPPSGSPIWCCGWRV